MESESVYGWQLPENLALEYFLTDIEVWINDYSFDEYSSKVENETSKEYASELFLQVNHLFDTDPSVDSMYAFLWEEEEKIRDAISFRGCATFSKRKKMLESMKKFSMSTYLWIKHCIVMDFISALDYIMNDAEFGPVEELND